MTRYILIRDLLQWSSWSKASGVNMQGVVQRRRNRQNLMRERDYLEEGGKGEYEYFVRESTNCIFLVGNVFYVITLIPEYL